MESNQTNWYSLCCKHIQIAFTCKILCECYVFFTDWKYVTARELKAGDVVNISPEVKHWHGAAKDSWFQHLAVEVPAEGYQTSIFLIYGNLSYSSSGKNSSHSLEAPSAGTSTARCWNNDDILFGENWNNEDIDLKTRSIITVVALMAQGITRKECHR